MSLDWNSSNAAGGIGSWMLPSSKRSCSATMRAEPSSRRSCTTAAVASAFCRLTTPSNTTAPANGSITQASRRPRRLCSMMHLPQQVAQAAQRDDGGVAAFELLAQAVHIDLDGIGRHAVLD